MTKPNRLAAVLQRPLHERPTVPAPAFVACKAAALREDYLTQRLDALELGATLRIDPRTQASLLALRDEVVGSAA